jgi:hypothetical protein
VEMATRLTNVRIRGSEREARREPKLNPAGVLPAGVEGGRACTPNVLSQGPRKNDFGKIVICPPGTMTYFIALWEVKEHIAARALVPPPSLPQPPPLHPGPPRRCHLLPGPHSSVSHSLCAFGGRQSWGHVFMLIIQITR